MVYLNLRRQAFKEIHLTIDIRESAEIQITTKSSFNVDYNEDNTACVARLRQEALIEDAPERFSIVVECVGQLSCEGISCEEDKRLAHIQAYTLIFPYVQGMVAALVTGAGLSPLMVERVKMKPEDVNLEKKK